jgi:adenylate cyclase
MSRDEAGTLARLKKLRSELFDPKTNEFGGRIFKNTGDGALAEFGSSVDAVQCAVEIQRALAMRNAQATEDQQIILRVGISQGDVIVDGEDLYGNGVNVAARMEGLAEPGGICVSGNVQEHIGNSLEVSLEDLGEQTVKNIDRPVRCYRVRLAPADIVEIPPPLPDKPSIAVLPFDNMSTDVEQEYFSDGITEDIITELSKISGLFVIARHSAFTYKGKLVTLKQVGRDLGVRYVLEGSVRKAGNRLRITAQLIDAETDHHLWAERYDRGIEDIFAVQDEVARAVADALEVALMPQELQLLAHAPTDNIEAYDLYLRSRGAPWPPTRTNLLTAQNAYARVIDMEPNFAGGYAGKSFAHSLAVMFGHSEVPENDSQIALKFAEQAIALDDAFAGSYSALGSAYSVLGRYSDAVDATRQAVEMQPGDADSHADYGRCLMFAGSTAEAEVAVRTAIRLDPQFIDGPYLNLLGRILFVAGEYDGSIDTYVQNKERGGPLTTNGFNWWVAAYGHLGRSDEARKLAEETKPYIFEFLSSSGKAHGVRFCEGEIEKLKDGFRKAGLAE